MNQQKAWYSLCVCHPDSFARGLRHPSVIFCRIVSHTPLLIVISEDPNDPIIAKLAYFPIYRILVSSPDMLQIKQPELLDISKQDAAVAADAIREVLAQA